MLEGGDRQGKKVYFAGDTAYRTVMEHEDENEVPVCPAFAEIGERIGPFDLALIPIGCVLSVVHTIYIPMSNDGETERILPDGCFQTCMLAHLTVYGYSRILKRRKL